jgi:hypothetical protein
LADVVEAEEQIEDGDARNAELVSVGFWSRIRFCGVEWVFFFIV